MVSGKPVILVATAVLLCGCASGLGIPLDYTPEPQEVPGIASTTFSVVVADERLKVLHGEVKPWHLGNYQRLGQGWNAVTDDEVPFADHMRDDLRRELQALRLVESAATPAKQIKVRILDWNFSANRNARFWYEIEISVADANGRQLASSVVKDRVLEFGKLLQGAKWSIEEDVPVWYGKVLRKLVRENPRILDALRTEQ